MGNIVSSGTMRWNKRCFFTAVLLIALAPIAVFAVEKAQREVAILAVNDVYRVEGVEGGRKGGLSMVRALRTELEEDYPDLLLLHAGDFLFPSLLSKWTQGAHMVDTMNGLDGALGVHDSHMFVVFGNHEFEKSKPQHAALLQSRIRQSEFQWLGSNIRFSQKGGRPLVASDNLQISKIVKSGGVRVGILGLTTNKKSAHKIAYVDEFVDPVSVALTQTHLLREQGAEVVIALTHLALHKDREVLETLGERGPDLIIGGHEHQRHHVEVDGRWILKADSDARTATVVHIQMIDRKPFISFGYRFLDRTVLTPDSDMQQWVSHILNNHGKWYCANKNEGPGCLKQAVGQTSVPLNGEEFEIRSYETNLGNWVADQIRSVVPSADIAFINAGSLRVNQTIPPGAITRRHVEELLHYDSKLVQAELTKEQLHAVLERATEVWGGKGHWLQISGFAYKHDPRAPKGSRVDEIRLFQHGKISELPDRPLQVITSKFLIEGGDGYSMLKSLKWISVERSLKGLLLTTLRTSPHAIQPRLDGRICNVAATPNRPCAYDIISHN